MWNIFRASKHVFSWRNFLKRILLQTSVVEIWIRSKSDLFAQFIMQGFLQKVPLLALLRFRNLNDSRHFRSSSKGEHNLLSQKLNCKTWLIFPYLYRHFYLLEINFLWFSGLTAWQKRFIFLTRYINRSDFEENWSQP